VNVLNKEKGMPSAAIKQSIKNLFSLPLLLKEPTPAIVEQTIEIMEKYRITAYDALFVARQKTQTANCLVPIEKAMERLQIVLSSC